MFELMLLSLFTSFAALLMSLGAYTRASRTKRLAIKVGDYVKTQNKRSLTLKRMAEVESTLTELTDSYDALLTSHKKLRSRIGMRATRDQKASNGLDAPDPATDQAGYKRVMRLKLRKEGKLI